MRRNPAQNNVADGDGYSSPGSLNELANFSARGGITGINQDGTKVPVPDSRREARFRSASTLRLGLPHITKYREKCERNGGLDEWRSRHGVSPFCLRTTTCVHSTSGARDIC